MYYNPYYLYGSMECMVMDWPEYGFSDPGQHNLLVICLSYIFWKIKTERPITTKLINLHGMGLSDFIKEGNSPKQFGNKKRFSAPNNPKTNR